MAQQIKEDRKNLYIASLRNCPTSPRKMRLVADLVRGMDVAKASAVLTVYKEARSSVTLRSCYDQQSQTLSKKQASDGKRLILMIKEISVDGGRVLEANSACTTGTGVPSAKAIKSRHNDSRFSEPRVQRAAIEEIKLKQQKPKPNGTERQIQSAID